MSTDNARLLAHAEPLLRALQGVLSFINEIETGACGCVGDLKCAVCHARDLIDEIDLPDEPAPDPDVELAAAEAWGDGP